MARMKQRRFRKTRVRKIGSRRMNASGAAGKRRPGAGDVGAKGRRPETPTVRVAATRVLVSAGRLAKDLALVGAQSAAHAGRRVVARGARSAAKGVRHAARGTGRLSSAALESIARRVEP